MAFSACQKVDNKNVVEENLITLTLKADKPSTVGTKTLMDGAMKTYWAKGDAIGVSNGSSTNYKFTSDATAATSETTTFTGTTEVSGTLYAYYPHQSNGVTEDGAKVDIASVQNPTSTSFDGKADVLVSKPIVLAEAGKELPATIQFRRLTAILKVVIKDAGSLLAGQNITELTVTSSAINLTGRAYVDFSEFAFGKLYYGQSKSVKAEYAEESKIPVNGSTGVYLCVYPGMFASGSTLTISGKTEDKLINKVITLSQDIAFGSGEITTLNVSVSSENISNVQGVTLPFEDDFSWQNETSSDAGITNISTSSSGKWLMANNVYKGGEKGAIRLGKSGDSGYIKSQDLNLSTNFHVIVSAKKYGSDDATLTVTIGETTKTATSALTADYADYLFEFEAATKSCPITVSTSTKKRTILNNVKVAAGAPSMAVTGVSLNKSETSLGVGETETLIATVKPTFATNKEVTWTSNKPEIATVDATGKVTGKATGTATITVKTDEGNKTATCTVNVTSTKTWTYTVVETSPTFNAENSVTVNEATWSIVMGDKVGSPSANGAPASYSNKYGWKWGDSGSKYWKSYTLSTDYFTNKKVKSVTVTFLNNGSKEGKMVVKQGTTIGTASATFGSTTWTELTANTTPGTGGTLTIQYSVAQASYINTITVKYED